MRKASFLVLFLAMCFGAPPVARAETTSPPDGSAVTLFVWDTNDVVAFTSAVVPMDVPEGLIFEMDSNQVAFVIADATPATVACGSDSAILTTSHADSGNLFMKPAASRFIHHPSVVQEVSPCSVAETQRFVIDVLGKASLMKMSAEGTQMFLGAVAQPLAPAWALFQGVASSALPARGSDGLTVAMFCGALVHAQFGSAALWA